MYSIQEQFKTDAFAQMNGRVRDAQTVAGTFLDLSREIGVLNVRTGKASAEQLAGMMQKLLGASNPGEFFQIAATVMQPDMQLWTRYVEQLGSIAGKAGAPVMAPLAWPAAPGVTWPKASTSTETLPVQAEPAAPAEEAPAVPAPMPPEAAMEPAPVSFMPPPADGPADGPDLATLGERIEEAPQPAASTSADPVEAIREVADAMTGAPRKPPVLMAASTPLVDEPVVPEIKVARKSVEARPARKPVSPAAKKAASPARSASGRGRKG
jgi:hypothetical protein